LSPTFTVKQHTYQADADTIIKPFSGTTGTGPGKRMHDFLGRFYFYFSPVLYFGGGFNKTIIPLTLVGYEMIKADSYPGCAHGIIVNEARP